jgi:hypothetical protein
MGKQHTNSKGVKYYLHNRGRLFFFSKKAKSSVDMPAGMEVMENKRTGLPMLRRLARRQLEDRHKTLTTLRPAGAGDKSHVGT